MNDLINELKNKYAGIDGDISKLMSEADKVYNELDKNQKKQLGSVYQNLIDQNKRYENQKEEIKNRLSKTKI